MESHSLLLMQKVAGAKGKAMEITAEIRRDGVLERLCWLRVNGERVSGVIESRAVAAPAPNRRCT